ncbi:probable N-acetyltransferase HLS1 [Actinidia eriantha]|uniref:probable N-acetyltransferase HLS1 n=1 Tax=Actinidia eriantha TaxID=165200 RepID=UPI00258775F4|nr:probable N-acetyltransferase HLS1 [Actinidia eriantha]
MSQLDTNLAKCIGEKMMNKVVIREFDEDKDVEVVMKLEKSCETNSSQTKGISIISNTNGDPLSRIRFYNVHVMLVAELQKKRELVGMVRGCIKYVGTKFRGGHVQLGCILGLRVSPKHRRMGIGLKLLQSIEEWMMNNGAQYTFLATEEKNIASKNLFTLRCNYTKSSSLVIYLQPLSLHSKNQPQDIKIERLSTDQAISFYKNHVLAKDIYPTDIDTILKEKLSLGTWVSYFKEEGSIVLHNKEKNENTSSETPSSWAIFSIWNTCEAYKLQIRSQEVKFFKATLSQAKDKIFTCLKMPRFECESLDEPFGFLFLYGLHGEGERLGELMESIWVFASRLAENVKECKAIMVELAVSDPLRELVPKGSTISCINDLWYLKRVNSPAHDDDDDLIAKGPFGNVFVDPRDF